jgi:hypothetical protein
MKAITLHVKNDTAERINSLSEDKKLELTQLIDLWVSKPRPILQVMEDIGVYAAKQGLTEEKLNELLKE